MTLATQTTIRSRARLSSVSTSRLTEEGCRIEIVDNALHGHDPELAATVEEQLRRVLANEALGTVKVSFRVCRADDESLQFICKVENPPRVDTDVMMPWRWWSPIMANADEFTAALEDGLRVRRARLSPPAF